MGQLDRKPQRRVARARSQRLTVMRVAAVSALADGLLALAMRRAAAARHREPAVQPALPPERRPWKTAAFDRTVAVIAAAAAVLAVLQVHWPAATGLAANGGSYRASPHPATYGGQVSGSVTVWNLGHRKGPRLPESALSPSGDPPDNVVLWR